MEEQLTDSGVIVEVSVAPGVLKSGFLQSFIVVKFPLYIYGITEQIDENERLLLVSYHPTREQALMPPESVNVVDAKLLQRLGGGRSNGDHIRVYHAIWLEFGALSKLRDVQEGELCNIGCTMKAHEMPPEEHVRDVPFFAIFGKYRRVNKFVQSDFLLWELDLVGQPTYDNIVEDDHDGLSDTKTVPLANEVGRGTKSPLAMRNYSESSTSHRGLRHLGDNSLGDNPQQFVAGGVWDIAHVLQNETAAILLLPWVSFYFKNIQQHELLPPKPRKMSGQSKPKKKKVAQKQMLNLESSSCSDDEEDYPPRRIITTTTKRQPATRSNPKRSARGAHNKRQ